MPGVIGHRRRILNFAVKCLQGPQDPYTAQIYPDTFDVDAIRSPTRYRIPLTTESAFQFLVNEGQDSVREVTIRSPLENINVKTVCFQYVDIGTHQNL
jgi:hypothetical protein